MAKWYEEWFDQAEYEFVYQHRDEDDATALLDSIERTLSPSPGDSILDVGCGRGRHAIELAVRGYNVTGIDLSTQSIADARTRAANANVSVEFEVMDMRTPFCDECFDGVANLFTAFGYFEDQHEHQAAIDAMAAALKPGGWLVQDFLNPPYVTANLVPQSLDERNGRTIEQQRWIEGGRINKKIILRDQNQDIDDATFMESVALLELDDFKSMYARADLELVKVLGSYHGADYSESTPRMILFSRKRVESDS